MVDRDVDVSMADDDDVQESVTAEGMPDPEATKYRYRLPDGQTFETTNLAKLKREHPDATIIARVIPQGPGGHVAVEYRGAQPWDRGADAETDTPVAVEDAPVDVEKASPRNEPTDMVVEVEMAHATRSRGEKRVTTDTKK